MKKEDKINKYEYERIPCIGSDAASVQRQIDSLREKGWKNLRFCPNNRDCDCSGDEIEGKRPRNDKEIESIKQWLVKKHKLEISKLKSSAKKYGYKLVKI